MLHSANVKARKNQTQNQRSAGEKKVQIDPMLFWNIMLTVVVAPFAWAFSKMFQEVKRLQLKLVETREEYATKVDTHLIKQDLNGDIKEVIIHLQRLEDKLDRLSERERR